MRHTKTLTVLLAVLVSAWPAGGATRTLDMDPDSTQITFLLEATGHDVEGTLYLRDGHLEIDPAAGTASGELTIDATRTDTGNEKRDKTLHAKVLESAAHPLIVFTAKAFRGTLPETGAGDFEIEGTISIDGADHPFVLPAKVEVEGDHFTAKTTFSVPYVEWGMHDPSFLFLRVAKAVDVTVAAAGSLVTPPMETSSP